jgi:hypothetical protein
MAKVKFVEKTGPNGHTYHVADMSRQFEGYVTQDGSGAGLDTAAIDAAQRSLDKISSGFDLWLGDDVEALNKAYKAWLKDVSDEERTGVFYRKAFDLRGQSHTLGQPLVGDMASSLALLLEHLTELPSSPHDLIAAHVQAIRATMAQRKKPDSLPAARELADVLLEATRLLFAKNGIEE